MLSTYREKVVHALVSGIKNLMDEIERNYRHQATEECTAAHADRVALSKIKQFKLQQAASELQTKVYATAAGVLMLFFLCAFFFSFLDIYWRLYMLLWGVLVAAPIVLRLRRAPLPLLSARRSPCLRRTHGTPTPVAV